MQITLDIPPGLRSDDTALASSPAWADCNNTRFRLGRPQLIGGWESITLSTLTGVCRAVLPWTDNSAILNLAFGTHSALQVWVNGSSLANITPFGPISVLGSNPFATTNASATVTVTHTAHGLSTGNQVIITGATDTNGITAANLNGTRTITVTTTDAYTFTAGANATSTGTGGGSAVRIVPQVALPAGAIDGAGSAGYGTGAYGSGTYGTASTDTYYPRTWSLAAWGQKLLASPRGGGLYEWSNNTATRAVAVAGCPPQITYMLVSPQRQVFALGTNEETSGTFNPMCIRHSDVGTNTGWSSTATSASTSREYILPGGGRIVAGRVVGKYLLVWTNQALWLGTYVGQINQVWRFDKVGDKCGLIGPNAAVVVGDTAYWPSPDRQFHSYTLGGAVQPIPCPIREDWAENLAASQSDKIVGSSIAEYDEIRFDYPDSRDGYENSRYVALCVDGADAGSWYRGQMARTAMVDAGPSLYPCGVTYAGNIYWHEKGQTADGGAHTGYVETAELFFDPDRTACAKGCWPDIKSDQVGAVSLTIYSRLYPQGDVTTNGPYTVTVGQDQVDFFVKARLFRLRWSISSAPAYFRLGRPIFSVTQAGRR